MSHRGKAVLLDTSIQVDRLKSKSRQAEIERRLAGYTEVLATGIGLLEFKAVVIAQLITIHNQLRRKDARFTRVRDAILEKNHPQRALRAHIFNNIIKVFAGAFDIDEPADRKLAVKARLACENAIPQLYRWFRDQSCTTLLNATRINCTRAQEEPTKDGLAFPSNLPTCVFGVNRNCCVEEFIRRESSRIAGYLESLPESTAENADQHRQLVRARELFRRVRSDQDLRLSVSDCRSAGDCLIVLEGIGIAHDAMSTNQRDWEGLCNESGLNFIHVQYEDEKTY